MSILQEYEEYRKRIGEKEWKMINTFLDENRQYLLSDLLYSKNVWQIYEDWKNNK